MKGRRNTLKHSLSKFANLPKKKKKDTTKIKKYQTLDISSSKGVLFRIPLELLLEKHPGSCVPPFIEKLCYFIEHAALGVEGIFRISGDVNDVKATKRVVNEGMDLNLWQCSPHTLCSLLKMFVRELPDPLFSSSLYHELLDSASANKELTEEWMRAELRPLIQRLPLPNKFMLKRLMQLLNEVVERKEENKMIVNSLATVFGPNIIRPSETETNQQDMLPFAKLINAITAMMITHFEELFEDIVIIPTYVGLVKADYDYQASRGEEDEISLRIGDIIWLMDRDESDESGWWKGELRGVVGFFPNTYVSDYNFEFLRRRFSTATYRAAAANYARALQLNSTVTDKLLIAQQGREESVAEEGEMKAEGEGDEEAVGKSASAKEETENGTVEGNEQEEEEEEEEEEYEERYESPRNKLPPNKPLPPIPLPAVRPDVLPRPLPSSLLREIEENRKEGDGSILTNIPPPPTPATNEPDSTEENQKLQKEKKREELIRRQAAALKLNFSPTLSRLASSPVLSSSGSSNASTSIAPPNNKSPSVSSPALTSPIFQKPTSDTNNVHSPPTSPTSSSPSHSPTSSSPTSSSPRSNRSSLAAPLLDFNWLAAEHAEDYSSSSSSVSVRDHMHSINIGMRRLSTEMNDLDAELTRQLEDSEEEDELLGDQDEDENEMIYEPLTADELAQQRRERGRQSSSSSKHTKTRSNNSELDAGVEERLQIISGDNNSKAKRREQRLRSNSASKEELSLSTELLPSNSDPVILEPNGATDLSGETNMDSLTKKQRRRSDDILEIKQKEMTKEELANVVDQAIPEEVQPQQKQDAQQRQPQPPDLSSPSASASSLSSSATQIRGRSSSRPTPNNNINSKDNSRRRSRSQDRRHRHSMEVNKRDKMWLDKKLSAASLLDQREVSRTSSLPSASASSTTISAVSSSTSSSAYIRAQKKGNLKERSNSGNNVNTSNNTSNNKRGKDNVTDSNAVVSLETLNEQRKRMEEEVKMKERELQKIKDIREQFEQRRKEAELRRREAALFGGSLSFQEEDGASPMRGRRRVVTPTSSSSSLTRIRDKDWRKEGNDSVNKDLRDRTFSERERQKEKKGGAKKEKDRERYKEHSEKEAKDSDTQKTKEELKSEIARMEAELNAEREMRKKLEESTLNMAKDVDQLKNLVALLVQDKSKPQDG
ncbi:Rho GTPase-activating protein 29 [Balamuthia mandrillaris]